MPDPVATEIAGANSSTATTTVAFTARSAGELLVLSVASDDYATTAGAGRPESTGWTLLDSEQGNLGLYVWWKIAAAGEASVQYTIGSATRSSYAVQSISNIDTVSPLGVSNSNQSGVAAVRANHTTPAITPTAGSRWIVVATIGSTGNVTAGPYTWTAPYAEVSERYNTAGYRPGVTVATLVLDGGTSTSGTATFATTTSDQSMGIIAAWKNAVGGGANYNGAPGDAVGLTDAATAAASALRVHADPIGVNDTVAAQLNRAVTITDPVATTDAVTTGAAIGRTQADPVGATDAHVLNRSQTGAEPVATTDQVAATLAAGRAPADPVGITDTVDVDLTGSGTAQRDDTIGLTDAAGVSATTARGLTDGAGITDAVTVQATTSGSAGTSDDVTLADVTTTVLSVGRVVTEPVSVTDAVAVEFHWVVALTDTVDVDDTALVSDAPIAVDPRLTVASVITHAVSNVSDTHTAAAVQPTHTARSIR